MSTASGVIRVALDVPVPTLFDYRAGDVTRADVGRRVLVPFGKKRVLGVIVELARDSAIAPERLKPAFQVLRDEPALSGQDLEFMQFASDYYLHPLGPVVVGALPLRLRRAGQGPREKPGGCYRLTAAGEAAVGTLPARAHAQRQLIEWLRAGPREHAAVKALSAQAPRILKRMVANGWIAQEDDSPRPGSAGAAPAPQLTGEQRDAVERVCADLAAFRPFLLLGVAGSGKTEVYLHAIAAVLAQGRQALLLVPEIALTPQLEALVAARFPDTMTASLHSGLNERERYTHWLAAQSGRARIVLGTRLAVFTPMPELGIIIVDEEHDASFKQAEGFRYSARDLAVVRARQRGVPIVLGSATPALETYCNAVSGRYGLLTLKERIGAPAPAIACLDTRGELLGDGLSERLLAALREFHARGEQSLVFINRRGYAPVLLCRSCGWISGCRRCSAQLVLHLQDKGLRCHHCGHQAPVPAACPQCGNQDLKPMGQGTQRVEAALGGQLGGARVLRIDRDSTRRRGAWRSMRRRIQEREVDILVGTQILAKGHDFPHLNLVCVLNADSLLYSADFRAAEHLYALLTQVCGRAGRAATRGTVLIQTEFPHHPLYEALKRHDYRAFAESLLAERRQAGFPPFFHQALLRAEAPQLAAALGFLAAAAGQARRIGSAVTIYDPVPAAMPRKAGRERAQLLVQSESRPRLREFLREWRDQLAAQRSTRARWSLDVDPLEF